MSGSRSRLKDGVGSFKQQDLKGWQPVLTPVAVITILLCITIIFLPIGVILRASSENVIEEIIRYDNVTNCTVTANDNYLTLPKKCQINIKIKKTMEPPIYFYYELERFYQNHRRYLKSKSDTQLRDKMDKPKRFNLDCDPLSQGINGKNLLACGLIAGSFFEDRFSMSVNGIPLCNETNRCHNYGINASNEWKQHWHEWHESPNWQMEGIAWKSDLRAKFKETTQNPNSYTQIGPRQSISGLRLPNITNEDFVVWMRVAALPKFRKLHRQILNKTLFKGDNVTITILNWFPVSEFGGKKSIVLAKTTWCGGKNITLAWTYIIVACITIFLAVLLGVLLLFGSRKMADVDRFQWHNRPNKNEILPESA